VSLELKDAFTISIAVVGTIFGLITYNKNQTLKRQEIILPLIKEFDEYESLRYAKLILDDFTLNPKQDPEKREYRNIKSEGYYSKKNLSIILRYHRTTNTTGIESVDKPVYDQGEQDIRDSFSALLDFFGKLGYLLDIRAITKKEIRYFQYYIEKSKNNDAIIRYARLYEFQMFAVLLHKLGSLPEQLLSLKNDYYKGGRLRSRYDIITFGLHDKL
jgi:hypothetical protein